MRRTRLVASLAVASAASAAVLLSAAPALAYGGDGDGNSQSCSAISSDSVPAGSSASASACGFAAGEETDNSGHSTPVSLGHSIANSHGRVNVHFTVPADFPAGQHHLVIIGETSGHEVDIPFTVPSGGAGATSTSTSSGSTLPFTGGSDVWQMTLAGVVLVGAGGALLTVRRRRTHAAAV